MTAAQYRQLYLMWVRIAAVWMFSTAAWAFSADLGAVTWVAIAMSTCGLTAAAAVLWLNRKAQP